MKAVTLWQPWASLIACGVKRFETRSWPAYGLLVGEELAIHAGLRCASLADLDAVTLRTMLALFRDRPSLPSGAVVAIARFEGNYLVEHVRDPDPFGDYRPGRWAWRLGDVRTLAVPCPATGRQRIWDWTPGQHPEAVAPSALVRQPKLDGFNEAFASRVEPAQRPDVHQVSMRNR